MAGLATHYCEYNRLGELESALINCTNTSEIEDNLKIYCQNVESTKNSYELLLENVNKCFYGNSVEDIFDNLEKENSDWAAQQLKVLQAASPLSLKVTHRLIQAGRDLSLAKCLQMETRLGYRLVENNDFQEGNYYFAGNFITEYFIIFNRRASETCRQG